MFTVEMMLTVWEADSRLISFPSHLSFAEAASLGGAAGTAIHTLFFGPLPFKKGSTVVAQGTGGVSAFTIQVSRSYTPPCLIG